MKLEVNYVTDEKRLKAWNIKEPVIEFYNELQHTVVPLSKVSGLQIMNMLRRWPSIDNGELRSEKP